MIKRFLTGVVMIILAAAMALVGFAAAGADPSDLGIFRATACYVSIRLAALLSEWAFNYLIEGGNA